MKSSELHADSMGVEFLFPPILTPTFPLPFPVFKGTLKTRDWKTRDHIAGVENAGLENAGQDMQGWKTRDRHVWNAK